MLGWLVGGLVDWLMIGWFRNLLFSILDQLDAGANTGAGSDFKWELLLFLFLLTDNRCSFVLAPKPYIELSLVTKQEEHTHVNEIK